MSLGDLLGSKRRAIVGFIRIGAHKEDELRVAGVRLPVKLAAAREFTLDELIAHGLAGEIEGSLADGGVAVGVRRPHGVVRQAFEQVRPVRP